MVLNITVKTLDSQNHQFEVRDDFTVRQFKEHIQSTVGATPDEQRLIFCGRVMLDTSKLIDSDCNGKVIHLVRRPPPILDDPPEAPPSTDSSNPASNRSINSSGSSLDGNVLLGTLTLGADITINQIIGQMLQLQQSVYNRIPNMGTEPPRADGTPNQNPPQNAPRPLRMTITTMQASNVRAPNSTVPSNQVPASSGIRGQVLLDIDVDDSQSSSQTDLRYHDAKDTNSPRSSGSFQTASTSQSHGPIQSGSGNSNLSDVLRNHPDWIPIVEADILFMQRNSAQASTSSPAQTYFSDAYISSVPKKRRRLLASSSDRVLILHPSPPEAISNLLRRAIRSSGSEPNDGQLSRAIDEISSDPEIQTAYDEYLRSAVEARLRTDDGYCPKKFENSSKYFK